MINIEIKNEIAEITMNDGKVNALTLGIMKSIHTGLKNLEDSEAKAVILTGAGKSFSAGIDLIKMLKKGDDYRKEFGYYLNVLLEKFITFKKPLIAAVNGHAVAGGCILTVGCDYRMMADGHGKIGVTELKVGVPFPSVPMEILRNVIHNGFFNEVVYLGKLYSPKEGFDRGLINEIVAEDELMNRAREVANELGNAPSKAFQLVKSSVSQPILERVAQQENALGESIHAYWDSEEVRQNMQSFMDQISKGK